MIAIAAALTLTVAAATGVVTLIKANVSHADKVDDTTYHAFTDDMDASTPTVEGNSGELITLPDMERIPATGIPCSVWWAITSASWTPSSP